MESQPQILNLTDSKGLFDMIKVYLKKIDHLNLKLLIFIGIVQVQRFDFQKFTILEILNFHPWTWHLPSLIDIFDAHLNQH